MKVKKGLVRSMLLLCMVFALLLSGCQGSGTKTGNESDVQLEKNTKLAGDCVISSEQMASIAGKDGEYTFTGEMEDGTVYTWIYDGNYIENPQEQKLKVTADDALTDKVMEALGKECRGFGFSLEKMNMAAPAQLELTFSEKWNVENAAVYKYQDGKAVSICDAEVEESEDGGSIIRFQVTEVGDTFYLIGEKAEETEAESSASDETSKEETSKENPSSESESEKQAENSKESSISKETAASKETSASKKTSAAKETSASKKTSAAKETSAAKKTTAAKETSAAKKTTAAKETTAAKATTTQKATEAKKKTCTISIECSTILSNWDDLDPAKADYVPSSGWILSTTTVEFEDGETVFDVLKRVCKNKGIQMESSYTPMYSSYYIEGIHNLYEFDCGQQSGWMYRVNGWYPNYGCSSYTLKDGDKIEWKYTCSLGSDIGGGNY